MGRYGQFCPVAKSLEILGDQWTLLIVRDMLSGVTHFNDLERGGIVGKATITGCGDEILSPWFFGRFGFEISNAKPLPFLPCKGRLGFFEVDYQENAPPVGPASGVAQR